MTLFVASFGVANLRFGAQLAIRGPARAALLISLAIAALAAVRFLNAKTAARGERPADINRRMSPVFASLTAIGYVIVLALLVLSLFDVAAHRRGGARFGVNQWGYRGSLVGASHPGVHIAMVGGTRRSLRGPRVRHDSGPARQRHQRAPRLDAAQTRRSLCERRESRGAGCGRGLIRGDVARLRLPATRHRLRLRRIRHGVGAGLLGRHRSIVFQATGYSPDRRRRCCVANRTPRPRILHLRRCCSMLRRKQRISPARVRPPLLRRDGRHRARGASAGE